MRKYNSYSEILVNWIVSLTIKRLNYKITNLIFMKNIIERGLKSLINKIKLINVKVLTLI